MERTAIVIGLFELAFFAVVWAAHPSLAALAKDAVDLPIGNSAFMFLVAAVIGATFNPWMIFYQQSAIADKRLELAHLTPRTSSVRRARGIVAERRRRSGRRQCAK